MHPLSTELALKAFEADVAFSAALAQFQKDLPEETIFAEVRRAAGHGFSWFCRPSEPGFFEVRLRHSGGAEVSAEGESIAALLAGLLGHPLVDGVAPLAAQAAEPEQDEAVEAAADALLANLSPSTTPLVAAAESLAAATSGVVVTEPDESERLAAPLTDAQKSVAISMISSLSAEERKAFTISFRDAFRVPREAKSIAPLISEVRHLEFCDRWSFEAAGGVAP